MSAQSALFDQFEEQLRGVAVDRYAKYLVLFDGSICAICTVLHLLERGVSPRKITLLVGRLDKSSPQQSHSAGEYLQRMFGLQCEYMVNWYGKAIPLKEIDAQAIKQSRGCDRQPIVVVDCRVPSTGATGACLVLQPHKADRRGSKLKPFRIDLWRPLVGWSESQIRDLVSRWRISQPQDRVDEVRARGAHTHPAKERTQNALFA